MKRKRPRKKRRPNWRTSEDIHIEICARHFATRHQKPRSGMHGGPISQSEEELFAALAGPDA